MCRRDCSIRGALRRPVVGERIRLIPLRVGVLALQAFLFLLLRGHVPGHEVGISFLQRLFIGC